MAGRTCAWRVVYVMTILFASSTVDRTGATAMEQRSPRAVDGYPSPGEKVAMNSEYRDSLKVLPAAGNIEISSSSSSVEDKVRSPLAASLFRLQNPSDYAENIEPEVGETDDFDKRGPSSYKLKYGGLGKRRLGSSSLRYGGLGKRLSGNEEDREVDLNERGEDLDNESKKELLEAAYFLFGGPPPNKNKLEDVYDLHTSIKKSKDTISKSMMPAFAIRQYRSRAGMGMRYSGLGKRRLSLSNALNI